MKTVRSALCALALMVSATTVKAQTLGVICAPYASGPAYINGVYPVGTVTLTRLNHLGITRYNPTQEFAYYSMLPNPLTYNKIDQIPMYRVVWRDPAARFSCTRLMIPGTGTSQSNPAQFMTLYEQTQTIGGPVEWHEIDEATNTTSQGGGGTDNTQIYATCVWRVYSDSVTGQVLWTELVGCYY